MWYKKQKKIFKTYPANYTYGEVTIIHTPLSESLPGVFFWFFWNKIFTKNFWKGSRDFENTLTFNRMEKGMHFISLAEQNCSHCMQMCVGGMKNKSFSSTTKAIWISPCVCTSWSTFSECPLSLWVSAIDHHAFYTPLLWSTRSLLWSVSWCIRTMKETLHNPRNGDYCLAIFQTHNNPI